MWQQQTRSGCWSAGRSQAGSPLPAMASAPQLDGPLTKAGDSIGQGGAGGGTARIIARPALSLQEVTQSHMEGEGDGRLVAPRLRIIALKGHNHKKKCLQGPSPCCRLRAKRRGPAWTRPPRRLAARGRCSCYSRRRDCHFACTPYLSILKHLLQREGGAAECLAARGLAVHCAVTCSSLAMECDTTQTQTP